MDGPVTDNSVPQAKPKYWVSSDASVALATQLKFIPADAKVLEVGSGPGHMTQALAERGCDVVSIEVDLQAALHCEQFCRRLIVADIETVDLERELNDERFDVILLGDVLEHLRNAEMVLIKLQSHLSANGFLVVSLPNIAHGSVRFALLQGRFAYQDVGILDQTHVRFFTLQSIGSLFENTGFEIQSLARVRKGFFESEVEFDPLNIPVPTLLAVSSDPEATTYQFVIRAFRSTSLSRPVLTSRFRDLTWSDVKFKSDLAVDYKKRGFGFFWSDPPTFRRFFYRAFNLDRRLITFVYLAVSLLPYRFLKPFHVWLDIFSIEYMIPEICMFKTTTRRRRES